MSHGDDRSPTLRLRSEAMTVAIIVVSLILMALFVAVAVLGNRAQTRMAERDRKPDDPA